MHGYCPAFTLSIVTNEFESRAFRMLPFSRSANVHYTEIYKKSEVMYASTFHHLINDKIPSQFVESLSASKEGLCLIFVGRSLELPLYYTYSTLLAVITYY